MSDLFLSSPASLAAAALAMAAILLLHAWRRKSRPKAVPSTLLWQRLAERVAARSALRRILASLPLLLQLAAAALMGLAMARPVVSVQRQPEQRVLVLVDLSASMAASGRWEAAQRSLLERLGVGSPPGGEGDRPGAGARASYSVVGVGPVPVVALAESTRIGELEAALASLQPAGGGADWAQAASTATALLQPGDHNRVYVLTDGQFGDAALDLLVPLRQRASLEILRAGAAAPNLAITRLEARPSGLYPDQYQVGLRVENHAPEPAAVLLSARGPEGPVAEEQLQLAPFGKADRVVAYQVRAAGPVWFELRSLAGTSTASGLSADDRAAVVFRDPAEGGVLMALVGEPSYFLDRALAALPAVGVVRRAELSAEAAASFDLVMYVGRPIPGDATFNAVSWGSGGQAPGDTPAGAREAGAQEPGAQEGATQEVLSWDRAHPAFRFVDWQGVWVEMAAGVEAAPSPGAPVGLDWQPAVFAESGAVAWVRETERYRQVSFAFRPEDSNLPLRVAFPVLIANLLRWAVPGAWELSVPPAEPGRMPDGARAALAARPRGPGAASARVELVGADGSVVRGLEAGVEPDPLFLARPGVYTLRVPAQSGGSDGEPILHQWSVLVPAAESDTWIVAPIRALSLPALAPAASSGRSGAGSAPARLSQALDLWRMAVAVALVALLAEAAVAWGASRRRLGRPGARSWSSP